MYGHKVGDSQQAPSLNLRGAKRFRILRFEFVKDREEEFE